jgi:hypothetical protein
MRSLSSGCPGSNGGHYLIYFLAHPLSEQFSGFWGPEHGSHLQSQASGLVQPWRDPHKNNGDSCFSQLQDHIDGSDGAIGNDQVRSKGED